MTERLSDRLFFSCLPAVDEVLNIWIPEDSDAQIPAGWLNPAHDCIIICGVAEAEMATFMLRVHGRNSELLGWFRSKYHGQQFDVTVTPILYFESFSAAQDCQKLLQVLDYGDAVELVDELVFGHYDPWGPLTVISDYDWFLTAEKYCV